MFKNTRALIMKFKCIPANGAVLAFEIALFNGLDWKKDDTSIKAAITRLWSS